MDETEIYVSMVDCPEIQDQKEEFEDGDWFAYYIPASYARPEGKGELVISIVGTSYYSFNRKDVRRYNSLSTVGWDEGDSESVWKGKIIWLPTQGQIQKMLGVEKDIRQGIKFLGAVKVRPLFWAENSSWEKYWLMAFMFERHKKVWEKEKWAVISIP